MHFLLVFALSLLTLRANEQSGSSPVQPPLGDNNKPELNNITTNKPAALDPTTRPAETGTTTTEAATVPTTKSTTTTSPVTAAQEHLRVTLPANCSSIWRCYRDSNCGVTKETDMRRVLEHTNSGNSNCALVVVRTLKREKGQEKERKIEFQTPYDSALRVNYLNYTIEFDPITGQVTCEPKESCAVVESDPAYQKGKNGPLHYKSATIRILSNRAKNGASPQLAKINSAGKEKKEKEDNTGTIIICCVAGVAIVLVIAIGVIAVFQRRLNKRAAVVQELAKGTKTSGCITGAALAHKMSAERRPLVSTPKEPTPRELTPKLAARSNAGSVVSVSTSGGTLRPTTSHTETLYQEKKQ